MNGASTEHQIRLLQGVDYEQDDLVAPVPAFGLVIIALSVIAWAAFIGAAYAIYYGAEVVLG